ncbi:MAG: hypothetical protein M3440_08540 [Chloroflexota bacterium]|nr:hypothetical protein [Chloroflexota bacterium]
MRAHAISDAEGDALADWFDAQVAAQVAAAGLLIDWPVPRDDAIRLAAHHHSIGVAIRDIRISQDDLNAAHDAALDITRCPDCDDVLPAEALRAVSGRQWDGCDVDETTYHCPACGSAGTL